MDSKAPRSYRISNHCPTAFLTISPHHNSCLYLWSWLLAGYPCSNFRLRILHTSCVALDQQRKKAPCTLQRSSNVRWSRAIASVAWSQLVRRTMTYSPPPRPRFQLTQSRNLWAFSSDSKPSQTRLLACQLLVT